MVLPPLVLPPQQLPQLSQPSRSMFLPAQPPPCQTAYQILHLHHLHQVSSLELVLSQLPHKMLEYLASLHKPFQKASSHRCPHKGRVSRCRECNGSAFCIPHGRRKEICKDCGGKSLCDHKIERRMCKVCKASGKGGSSLCNVHLVRRSLCKCTKASN